MVNEDVQNIVTKICDYVGGESTEELAQFSKDSWLFENTEYNHPMAFTEFAEAMDVLPKTEKKLKKKMPSKVDLSDEDGSLCPINQ
ncbi:hypothetical protein [Haloarcula sp. CBA1122]|uniref:hypothetical protein n=1 Tax=Haloarcula sp. CBA1122 TaxID=2668069 RepID=UPI00130CD50E|nr:hypothetical protein [Haloarcula sp. CBA1122]MUV49289.1 hypothetical protein [Haloarcula sp. CBA1122]